MSDNQNNIQENEELTGLAEHYPMILNGEEYQYLKTNNFGLKDSVFTHETESGKQEDSTSRRGRKSISISGVVLQPLLKKLLELQELDEFTSQIYDPKINGYITVQGRIGPNTMSYGLKEKSAKLTTTNGVWNVSFQLEEF